MAKLQAGLTARALRIDFGRLDLWDYDERRQNFPALDLALNEKDENAEQQQQHEGQPESGG